MCHFGDSKWHTHTFHLISNIPRKDVDESTEANSSALNVLRALFRQGFQLRSVLTKKQLKQVETKC